MNTFYWFLKYEQYLLKQDLCTFIRAWLFNGVDYKPGKNRNVRLILPNFCRILQNAN